MKPGRLCVMPLAADLRARAQPDTRPFPSRVGAAPAAGRMLLLGPVPTPGGRGRGRTYWGVALRDAGGADGRFVTYVRLSCGRQAARGGRWWSGRKEPVRWLHVSVS